MALIAYDDADAAAFAASRHLRDDALGAWRAAVAGHISPGPGTRVVDLGCGTGSWARAFRTWWPGVEVVGVEPAAAMRERTVFRPVVGGCAEAIPLASASAHLVWLSTVLHHLPDRGAAAAEIHRVLRPGAPVLIRSAFAGRHEGIALFRYFPEAVAVLDRYPSVGETEAAFVSAGFSAVTLQGVPQISAPSLADFAMRLERAAHTPLQLISDAAYASGLARLHAAARTDTGPVVDTLDLLVLRRTDDW